MQTVHPLSGRHARSAQAAVHPLSGKQTADIHAGCAPAQRRADSRHACRLCTRSAAGMHTTHRQAQQCLLFWGLS